MKRKENTHTNSKERNAKHNVYKKIIVSGRDDIVETPNMYQQKTFSRLCGQSVAIEKVLNVGSRSPKQTLIKETWYGT